MWDRRGISQIARRARACDRHPLRRRRSLISAQALERSDNPGISTLKYNLTLKGFANRRTLSGFSRLIVFMNPGFSLRSNPGLKLANAFGVRILLTDPPWAHNMRAYLNASSVWSSSTLKRLQLSIFGLPSLSTRSLHCPWMFRPAPNRRICYGHPAAPLRKDHSASR